VLISRDRPTIVFLTVCTLNRAATLAKQIYHDVLVQAWTQADAWLVGAYVIMPDHNTFSARQRMKRLRLSIGSLSGNGNFGARLAQSRLASNHVAFIIACRATGNLPLKK
jgi:hypothetical protein